ncbi:MAG: oligosaccharide flippase family protein [Oliverpabstia sp.]|nr:oligosaccharide flippase family protein [Oliverpabstia sp.]
MKNRTNVFFVNTLMLYILTFSNYLFSFITVPYQTRIFGAEIYGNLGFATATMIYFQLVLDFGFLLSATEEVARNRENKKELSKIVEKVWICKTVLIAISAIALFGMCMFIERFRNDWLLFALYFISIAINSYIPDFLYRGLEKMKAITIRTVLIKFFFTIMIFIFLKDRNQYYLVPILNILGNMVALIGVLWHLKTKIGIKPVKITVKETKRAFKESSVFFYSRIASTVYSTTNMFVLGILYGESSKTVGLYSSADKLISTGKQGITPITDSLYPYMVRNKDFKLVKKILLIGMPILTIGCIGVAIFAEPICILLFGKEFASAAIYLRLLAVTVWCAFPGMIFGFPVLSPMGLTKWANISNIFGAIIQILLLCSLYFMKNLNAVSICIATGITEISTMCFRVFVVLVNRKKLKR